MQKIATAWRNPMFDPKMHEKCDAYGKDLLEEFLLQRGVEIGFRDQEDFYEHGDMLVYFGERGRKLGLLSAVATIEAEVRGAEGPSPWVEDSVPGHPYRFSFPTVSVEERKAKAPHAILQVSFDFQTPNATVELMKDASNEAWWEYVDTEKRGRERMARIPRYRCLLIHKTNGIWQVCPRCNAEGEGRSESQEILLQLLWPEGVGW
jgi:hypothetical protein